MPRYVSLMKYSPSARTSIREEGFAARVEVARKAVESMGGTFEAMHYIAGGEWDSLIQMELPSPADMFAMINMVSATGTFEKVETHQLFTGEEADSAAAKQMSWKPPG